MRACHGEPWTPYSPTPPSRISSRSTGTCTGTRSCRSRSTAPPASSPSGSRHSGYEVTTGVGAHRAWSACCATAPGPTVLLRADMDALPVLEGTGLPYASTARAVDADGHDVPGDARVRPRRARHLPARRAATLLAERPDAWRARVLVVFQPAEEVGAGRAGDDRRRPVRAVRRGPTSCWASTSRRSRPARWRCDRGRRSPAPTALRVTLHGRGGHGSRARDDRRPGRHGRGDRDAAADHRRRARWPAPTPPWSPSARSAPGPRRTSSRTTRSCWSASAPSTRRCASGVLDADRADRRTARPPPSGAPRTPEIELTGSFPAVVNDAAAVDADPGRLRAVLGPGGSSTRGWSPAARTSGCWPPPPARRCVFWLLGGADPQDFRQARSVEEVRERLATVPSNHSPQYAPVPRPTIDVGVAALVSATRDWLPASS